MDELSPLSDFFAAIEKDGRISLTHIGVYAAIIGYWKSEGCANPFRVYSYDIMRIAKISAHATWHKAVKDLDAYGYLKYEPSFKRNKGSSIFLKIDEK